MFQSHPDMKMIALPDAQETSDVACDTGSDPEVLRKEMEEKNVPIDLGLVHDGWNNKVGCYSTPSGDRFGSADQWRAI